MPPGKYIRTIEIRKKQSEKMKGKIPYNKGKKSKYSGILHPMFGRKHTKKSKNKISISQKKRLSKVYTDDNCNVHNWAYKKFGSPNYCEICKSTTKSKYDWSNKDHKYSLKKEDWQRLCRSCHMKYDIKNNNRQFFGKFKTN